MSTRREAESLASPFPALQAKAERVAAVVAQGVHGRRRAGTGETFWQYRNYDPSDMARSIDWRRSARGDQVYVRELEWEAANTVYLWRDGSPGMDWRSDTALPIKAERADVLALALSALLLRGGERCAVLGTSGRPRSGRVGMDRLTQDLRAASGDTARLSGDIPAHAKLVIASDFLAGVEAWTARLSALSARPASGVLLHIIDPAEADFPYRGRVEVTASGADLPHVLGRAERAASEYRAKFAAHVEGIARTARRLGWDVVTHRTDAPTREALTALYNRMGGVA